MADGAIADYCRLQRRFVAQVVLDSARGRLEYGVTLLCLSVSRLRGGAILTTPVEKRPV